jgi:serine/threonine-protein kinase
MDRDPFDLVGDTLDGQFRVVAFAGEGDLSVVYKGHHIGVDAPVAIKCLDLPTTLDGALVRPLVESFREASRLHYKLARGNLNIAQSIASGSTLAPATGMIVPYLVREWFDGESLGSDLARRREEGKKGRTVEEVVALLDPAVDAVAYAHAQGALHLSLNPSNLFLAERAGKRSLKVLDFGVSRAMNDLALEIPPESRPAAGLRVLFPAYAAPEQLDTTVGKPGAWTDVYAIALLMMELLSDRVVMAGQETGALVDRALDDQRRPTPRTHGLELPRNLDLVLTRAVARAPERRQKNATDFWNDTKTSLRGNTSRGMSSARAPSKPTSTVVGMAAPTLPSVAPTPPSAPPSPPSSPPVVGALASKRLIVPATASMGTIPMGFHPETPGGPTYVPLPLPAVESAPQEEPDLPPVHVVATPPPPQAATPALPPVMVTLDSPLPLPAPPQPVAPWPPPPILPRVRQSPTFPIIEPPARRRRSGALLASILTGVVGASLGVGLVIAVMRHQAKHASLDTPVAASALASALPPASASASSSASASASAADAAGGPPPTAHFPAATAKQVLDAAAKDIGHCKRGKVWGIASANVTFGNDGNVAHVAISVPFTGTPTGQCVSDALTTAKVPPFAGKPGVVAYRFFVPLK